MLYRYILCIQISLAVVKSYMRAFSLTLLGLFVVCYVGFIAAQVPQLIYR